jgi:hypothetical protein
VTPAAFFAAKARLFPASSLSGTSSMICSDAGEEGEKLIPSQLSDISLDGCVDLH